MKIFVLRRSFFTFRGCKAHELALAGKDTLSRMCSDLGAQVTDGALPAGEKCVLWAVFPFLTREKLAAYLCSHAGSVRFRGGFLERGGAFSEAEPPDAGMFTLADYTAMRGRAFSEKAEALRRGGVCVEEGAQVDDACVLGEGCFVGSGCVLRGACVLGENVTVEGASVLADCSVGSGTRIVSSHADHAALGADCSVGPFSFLRAGTRLEDGVRIGSFVECKNAHIGSGSKAAHLAYIGDAELGEGVNVGCGVVFANFDGKNKHRTRVGSGTFLGCNCNLVAPVNVGKGCFVAAGTTVTRDLADGDFCIGRSRALAVKKGAGKYLS